MLLFKATLSLSVVTLAVGFFEWKNCGKYMPGNNKFYFVSLIYIAIGIGSIEEKINEARQRDMAVEFVLSWLPAEQLCCLRSIFHLALTNFSPSYKMTEMPLGLALASTYFICLGEFEEGA